MHITWKRWKCWVSGPKPCCQVAPSESNSSGGLTTELSIALRCSCNVAHIARSVHCWRESDPQTFPAFLCPSASGCFLSVLCRFFLSFVIAWRYFQNVLYSCASPCLEAGHGASVCKALGSISHTKPLKQNRVMHLVFLPTFFFFLWWFYIFVLGVYF